MPNTIAQNLTRLANAKEAIGAAIAEKGVIVGEEDGLENFSSLILSIPSGSADLNNAALRLIDWEGTVLKEYTATQVASLTELPTPSSLNSAVDRDLLTFQGWNWSLTDIKSWVIAHEDEYLNVGAIYTTNDGEDHTYWDDPVFGTDMRFAVTQKQGTESIGDNTFKYCSSLENVNIPSGVISIGTSAFHYCSSLKNINIPDSVISIGGYVFQYCTSLKNVNIPSGVISIGTSAFHYCSSLKSINIPSGVTSIGGNVFNYCTSLKSVNIPDSVTSIGSAAFYYCTSLKSINIPSGVTSIGASAFNTCTALNAIVVNGKSGLSNINAFSNIYSGCLIYVPRANLDWFETATNWATFYAQDKIVTIEDNVDFLRAIGIDI